MKTFTRALAGVLAAAVIVLGTLSALGGTVLSDLPFFSDMRTGAANAMIDASGIKGRIEDKLRSNASAIAQATGLSETEVSGAIDALDIPSWSAAELPDGAVATGSASASYGGTSATVTTYADPSYVTVDAYGQSVTLSVPASAQGYLPYLSYLQ